MTRWKLTIEYDGTPFSGWQRQDNAPSVQRVIESAIEMFSGEKITLHCAGRTDAGVHACAQVAHVDLVKETTSEVVRDALNFYLIPHPVSITKVEQVTRDFHARFGAIRRSYRYRIINRRAPLTFQSAYAWHVRKPLDVKAMQTAADVLLGQHDFSTFRAQNCQANSPIRTLEKLDFSQNGEEIMLFTEARSFLYHQVRNMVGTLTLIGTGRWTLDEFKAAFAACDRAKGGPTAPPQGLYFWEVGYRENPN